MAEVRPTAARIVGRTRYRLGTLRLRAARRIGPWPLRLRRPFFSPARELDRILAQHPSQTADDWNSHQPVLVELLQQIPHARVLELGIGFGSTPIVLGLSGSSVSLETDERWYRRFSRFDSREHRILRWSDFTHWEWRNCPYLDEDWDVVLVDNAPAGSRQANVVAVADRARFIVCHDTEELYKPSAADYRWDFSGFRNVWTYTQFPTYTTVVSNVDPIPLTRLEGIEGQPPLRAKARPV